MGEPLDFSLARNIAIAMLMGALVGIDREKKLAEQGRRGIGGVRTFILLGLLGGASAFGAQAWDLSLAHAGGVVGRRRAGAGGLYPARASEA